MHYLFDGSYSPQEYNNFPIELNFMMKTILGSKIKDALDKAVDGLAAMSEGRLPEGVDPSMFPEGFDPYKNGFHS